MIVTQEMKDRLANLCDKSREVSDQYWHLWYALTLFTVGQTVAFVCQEADCAWEPPWIGQPVCPEHAHVATYAICPGSHKEFRVKKVISNPSQMSTAALESGASEELRDVS